MNNDLENEIFAMYVFKVSDKENRPLPDTSVVICTHLVLLLDSPFSSVDHLALFLRNGLLHRIGPRRTRQISNLRLAKLQPQN